MGKLTMIAGMPLLLLAACGNAGPEDTVKSFHKDVAAGEISAAADRLDPQLRQMGGPKILAALNRGHDQAEQKGGVKSMEITNDSVEGDHGSITVKTTFGDGTNQTDKSNVRKVDGKWYITM